jgi:hypothetical protein
VRNNLDELGDPWAPESEKRKSRLVPVVVCTLSFAAVLGIILVTTNITGGDSSTDSSASTAGVGAGSGSGTSSDTAKAVQDWYVGGGETHLTTVSRDLTSITDDRSANDLTSLQSDCTTLLTDVQTAQVYSPIPDTTAQDHWSKALSGLAQGAADCSDGAVAQSTSQVTNAGDELDAANTELTLASDQVNMLTNG